MAQNRKSWEACESESIIWQIGAYIRLSKEDGLEESMSVTNQKKIINEYLEQGFQENFTLIDYYIDDGLTGTDYERPDFQRMIRDMEAGKINCILCKNLSRMFRNYSDQGYFLEKIFPKSNARFITVSEPKVDSYLHPETIQGLEIPINGLMNDRFAAKTSRDIRDTFDTKRRKGEFIGAFAPYGYQKNPENKNSLIVDEEAAGVVNNVFHWFVAGGMSKNAIARRLNEMGVLNPAAYKRSKGLRYFSPQSPSNDGLWSQSTISSMLKNPVYLGTMVQGRQKVVNYKVHDKVAVPKEGWYVVENTHQPLIDIDTFEKAQRLQKQNTRTAPEKNVLHLFAGFIRCFDCKKAMTRHTSKSISYYYCRTFRNKSKALCTKHTAKEENLIQALLTVLQIQIALVGNISEIIETVSTYSPKSALKTLASPLKQRTQQLEKITGIMDSLYEDWKSGDISKDEYHRMKDKYQKQQGQLQQIIEGLQEDLAGKTIEFSDTDPYLAEFLQYKNICGLKRSILVDLIQNICVHEGGALEIQLAFQDPCL